LAAGALGVLLLVGCSSGESDNAVELTDSAAQVVATEDGTALRISGTVVNASDEVLNDVVITVVPHDGLDPYLVAGAVGIPLPSIDMVYPAATPLAEVPAGGSVGIDVDDVRPLAGAGADLTDILELADVVTLKVTWDGGQQVLTIAGPVGDPDGLLEG